MRFVLFLLLLAIAINALSELFKKRRLSLGRILSAVFLLAVTGAYLRRIFKGFQKI